MASPAKPLDKFLIRTTAAYDDKVGDRTIILKILDWKGSSHHPHEETIKSSLLLLIILLLYLSNSRWVIISADMK